MTGLRAEFRPARAVLNIAYIKLGVRSSEEPLIAERGTKDVQFLVGQGKKKAGLCAGHAIKAIE